MKKISMAICDSGQPYIEKLAEYFICKKGDRLQISTFSKQNIFRQAKKQTNFDVVLLGKGFEEKEEDEGNTLWIRLVESLECTVGAFQGNSNGKFYENTKEKRPVIFKYQCADEILRQIFEHLQKLEKEEVNIYTGRKEIIGFYSPCHSRMQTPFALTLAQIFSDERKVLYVNLGEWAGFERWFEEEYNLDLSDLLYMISSCETRVQGMLESVLHTINRVDYIPPMLDAQLLCDTSQEDYQRLLKLLVEGTAYEMIFLDFGVMIPGFFSLLDRCSHIYGVLDHGNLAQGQRQQFEAGIMRSNMRQLAEKIEYVSFSISESHITEREPVIHQWLYGELGDRARVIRGMQIGRN